jgi:hypothetical protein
MTVVKRIAKLADWFLLRVVHHTSTHGELAFSEWMVGNTEVEFLGGLPPFAEGVGGDAGCAI